MLRSRSNVKVRVFKKMTIEGALVLHKHVLFFLFSECLEFEVFYYVSRHPLCDIISFQEGYYDLFYCVEQCLDTPGCLSAVYSTDNCTLYDCNDHIPGLSYNFFIEKICTNGLYICTSLFDHCPGKKGFYHSTMMR